LAYTRLRGTALLETPSGVLVVSKDGRLFTLPGGGAKRGEDGEGAARRELKEETGLDTVNATYLFDFLGVTHTGLNGGVFRNLHKVFLMTANGVPRPSREVKHVAYYNGTQPLLSYSARRIIDRYHASKTPLNAKPSRRA
jgi:8-oxo-dGTP pyrophosphatase MutT (NUDIX family)